MLLEYIWKNTLFTHSHASLLEKSDTLLVQKMLILSQGSPYAQNEVMLQEFIKKCRDNTHENYFSSLFLALDNTEVIGFLNLNILHHEAEIDFICVDVKYRSQGIGKFLLDSFIKISQDNKQNIQDIFLEVGEKNSSAISFYKKLGFSTSGIRKKYYKNSEDAILMRKTL